MKFTLSWLKEHLDTDEPVEKLAETLTMIGLEVEHLEDQAKALAPYVIAKIITAVQHPNADRLRVCMVDTGEGAPLQVVCGAPNARAGLISVFAPPGTYIPGKDITLGIGNIRGVESRGMLCSAAELGISEDHDGIMELAADAPVGKPYAEWAGLGDAVIEINLTPNRADATGVHGIARDLGAAGMGKFNNDAPKPIKGAFAAPAAVTVEDALLCPGFALRRVAGVKNGPSPEWLQRRLTSIGLRPINALVDITNFMTFDRGRPLHVFDAKKVTGNLVVRRAKAGETLAALDGKTYTLDDTMCVIADDTGVGSLAGIMGGESTGCDETTTDVLIESALWNEINIAQTGRKLGINSDARYRNERGIDPAFNLPGLELATRMVLDLCGGSPSEIFLAGEARVTRPVIDFPVTEIRRLAGIDPAIADVEAILDRLGYECRTDRAHGRIAATVPTWRPDVTMKADLVEEVVRIIGVDQIPPTPLPRLPGVARPVLTPIQMRTRRARRALAARGLVEAVTWSFISRKAAEAFGGGRAELTLANPIAADMSDMRPSLLPGLVAAAQRNADRGFADLALFEVGQVYAGDRPADQTISAAGIRHGTAGVNGAGRHWSAKAGPASVFDAKADALALLDTLGVAADRLQVVAEGPAWYHPGRCGTIRQGPKNVIGTFGELHPSVLEALDTSGPLAAFEITLDAVPAPRAKATKTKPPLVLSDLQPVRRDFAFVLDRGIEAAKVMKAAESADKKLISAVSVFDLFESDSLGEGKKSLAIEVTLQPTAKTLTDDEIDRVSKRIVAEVVKATGGTLRA